MSGLDANLEAVERIAPTDGESSKPDMTAVHRPFKPDIDESLRKPDREWYIPGGWTTLRHGSNLARDEWKGKEDLLDQPTLNIKTRYPGLSCISTEDALRDQADAKFTNSSSFDTTSGYSTTEKEGSMPIEIQVALPIIHDRIKTPQSEELRRAYQQKYPDVMPQLLLFLNETWWRRNQQHPVVPNGTQLTKVDETQENGRRVVRYVPDNLLKIYDNENAKPKNT